MFLSHFLKHNRTAGHQILKRFPETNQNLRNYATRKRFYKKTGILYNDGKYEVTLDQKKLKTPIGKPFCVESEPLALAVAAEWDAQRVKIQPSLMHVNALCSTTLDNPNNLNKVDMVNYMVNYLTTDTLLFHTHEDDALYELQQEKWDPVIQWFCDRFAVDIKKTRGIDVPVISTETKAILTKHFLSYNFAAMNGYTYGIDTLKSVILMLACIERFLSPEEAVHLSRLEEEFQTYHWGKVEWAHDLGQQELQARLSAAVLFVHLNTSDHKQQTKSINR